MAEVRSTTFDLATFLEKAGARRKLIHLLPKGVFFSQGDSAGAVFYHRMGRAKLTVASPGGKEAIIALLRAGKFFGEESLASAGDRCRPNGRFHARPRADVEYSIGGRGFRVGQDATGRRHIAYSIPGQGPVQPVILFQSRVAGEEQLPCFAHLQVEPTKDRMIPAIQTTWPIKRTSG